MRKLFLLLTALFVLATPALAADETLPDGADDDCAHDFEISVLREATCTDKGLVAYTCGKCGFAYTAETLPDGEHDYELTGTTATCTQDGEATYTCARCGDTYTEAVTASGHVPEKADATCTHSQRCSVCGEVLTPAFGHSYVYQYDAEQDQDGGFVTFGTWRCMGCGRTLDATEGNALYYYSLPEEERTVPASGTDTELGQIPVNASGTDAYDALGDASSTEADAGQDQTADPNSALWVVISAILLIVIGAEAVALVRSLSKKKVER